MLEQDKDTLKVLQKTRDTSHLNRSPEGLFKTGPERSLDPGYKSILARAVVKSMLPNGYRG